MSHLMGRVRDAVRDDRRADADQLVARLQALSGFLYRVEGHLPPERLADAQTLLERAGTRLSLSRNHTVVALAGSTGSGKSSLFNALAKFDMSPVGVRRPTTGAAYACVWGPPSEATELLDWIGVPPRHRFVRESALDGEDEAALRGLVLLDLPDFDSVEHAHKLEVDRLLGLVDLVVWVTDPQKYADRVVHESYLRQFRRHADVTVVVLNHADRLPPAEVPRVGADLRRLLEADGLPNVPVLATSALHQAGIATLRSTLEEAVARRQAMLRRLAGDLEAVVEPLTELVAAEPTGQGVDQTRVRRLNEALASFAGVPAIVEATEQAYRQQAGKATDWPLVRGWRRLRPDPLRRLNLPGGTDADQGEQGAPSPGARPGLGGATTGPGLAARRGPLGTASMPAPTAAHRSAIGLAVRAVADQVGAGLPTPWPAAMTAAARSRMADLPDALDKAVARVDLGLDRRPLWWRLIGLAQWLVVLAAVVGLGWLVIGYAVRALGLPPLDYPMVGGLPLPTLLLLGGLLLGLVVGLAVRPVVDWAARRARSRAEAQLRNAIEDVGREYVITPVHSVLEAYRRAREALAVAAG